MTEPTNELRQAVALAVCEAWGLNADVLLDFPPVLRAADAAIKAYEAHRPRAEAERDQQAARIKELEYEMQRIAWHDLDWRQTQKIARAALEDKR
jgi:translation initiation factor IF-3